MPKCLPAFSLSPPDAKSEALLALVGIFEELGQRLHLRGPGDFCGQKHKGQKLQQ